MKLKGFSAQAGRFWPKTCGHTTGDRALASGGKQGVSVGGWLGLKVSFDCLRLVERALFTLLSLRWLGCSLDRKSLASQELSQRQSASSLMEIKARVGTRLRGASCNVLNSGWNFNPLPTDRKLGPDRACSILTSTAKSGFWVQYSRSWSVILLDAACSRALKVSYVATLVTSFIDEPA